MALYHSHFLQYLPQTESLQNSYLLVPIAWEVLSTDMGFVLIRWHGKIIETTVAYGLIFWLLISVALWSLWFLLRLPFNAWQSLAKKQAQDDEKFRSRIEGKFGEAKRRFSLGRVMTKLSETSKTAIAITFLVMNLSTLLRQFFAFFVFT